MGARLAPISPCEGQHGAPPCGPPMKRTPKTMKLFAALRKRRDFERLQLPFIRSLIDFDIIIEIGYAQEQKKPLTPKPLFLLNIGSVTTVRRRLAELAKQGIVTVSYTHLT